MTSKLILVMEGELIMTKRLTKAGDTSRSKRFKDWSLRQAANSAVSTKQFKNWSRLAGRSVGCSQRSLKVAQSDPEWRATGSNSKVNPQTNDTVAT